jgi:soluble lytic murein transglycosylase
MKLRYSFYHFNTFLCLLILFVSMLCSTSAIAKKHKKKSIKHIPAVLTPSQQFTEAEKAFENGHYSKFEDYLSKLKAYPLYPYLLHKKLSHEISQHQANSYEINQFIHKYPDSPLAKQLADQWLALQANKKNWSSYLSLYEEPIQEEKDHKYQCYGLWAKYQGNEQLSELTPAIQFWHSGLPQAKSCETIFEELLTHNKLDYSDIWNRIEQALKKKQRPVAEYVSKYLSFEDKKVFRLWLKIHDQPHLVANNLIFDLEDYDSSQVPLIKKIITYGMAKLIKQDVAYATKVYPDIASNFELSSQQQGEIAKEFSISLAKKRSPLANRWFAEVPEKYQDTEYLSWKIRYGLFKENWADVLKTLNNLPLHEAKQSRWQYWKARALDELGHKSQSLSLFESLFHQRDYYGFLAHHYCKQPLPLDVGHANIEHKSMAEFHQQPSISRIKELLKLSRIQQAKREWFYKVSLLTDEEKIEAARFAHQMKWHDLAISTLSKTQDAKTLMLRFPLAHEPKIISESKKHAIDPAWVFALTRQESSFIPYAQSPVGAMGLMQLMPRTAQEVARTLKKHHPSQQDLANPNLNIELGTAYLKNLHGFMQKNPVLATASYNAGPGRIKQWLPSHTMAADIWIENIPFEETRDYVQNIITYTGIYRSILGKAVDLENMLPDISG